MRNTQFNVPEGLPNIVKKNEVESVLLQPRSRKRNKKTNKMIFLTKTIHTTRQMIS